MNFLAIGVTGLCGTQFVKKVSTASATQKLITISRKQPEIEDASKVNSILQPDSTKWAEEIKNADIPEHSTYFSAFGTTRAIAGSAEKFKEIDYGVNYECAKAARETGKFDTIILVSSVGANANSRLLYPSVKGQLEDDIIALKFPRTIILRPGPLTGRQQAKRFSETAINFIGKKVEGTGLEKFLFYPISGEKVATAAYILATTPASGDDAQVTYVNSKGMIDLCNM